MSRVRVVAVGSDHGDDRAGWDAARLAAPRLPPEADVVLTGDPLAVAEGRADALVVVDACRGAGSPGSVHRFDWPAPGLARVGAVSSHGVGVAAALDLATALGRLPRRVVILAVEMGNGGPGGDLSPGVAAGVPALAAAVTAEVARLTGGGPMDDPTPGADALKGLAFFAAATDDELRLLAAAARQERPPAGTVLFREGDRLDRFFVVADGDVAIEVAGPNRRPKRLQTVGPGELLGWSPVLGPGAMTATARALTPARVFAFDAAAVRATLDADPRLAAEFFKRVARVVARRLNATRLQLLDVYRADLPDAAAEGWSP